MTAENLLLEYFAPLLKVVQQLDLQQFKTADIAKERRNIVAHIAAMEAKAEFNTIDSVEYEHVKYAFTALVDEKVLYLLAENNEAWMGETLQLKYFAEHNAGENFFKRLEMMLQEPKRFSNGLACYFLCLQIGFKGKYWVSDEDELIVLQEQLFKQVKKQSEVVACNLASMAPVPMTQRATRLRAKWPANLILYVLIGDIILFIIYYLIILTRAHNLVTKIQNIF